MKLVCPNCEYSLRGLSGAYITCPECGAFCDVVEIIRHQPIDYFQIPEYRRMAAPAVSLIVGAFALILLAALIGDVGWVAMVGGTGVLIWWAVKMAAATANGSGAEALRLIVLLHGV